LECISIIGGDIVLQAAVLLEATLGYRPHCATGSSTIGDNMVEGISMGGSVISSYDQVTIKLRSSYDQVPEELDQISIRLRSMGLLLGKFDVAAAVHDVTAVDVRYGPMLNSVSVEGAVDRL
jgi:hypothetical protein